MSTLQNVGWAVAVTTGVAAASTAFWVSRYLSEDPAGTSAEERRAKLANYADGLATNIFVGVPEVTAPELRQLLDDEGKRVVLVDVRTSEEQQVSMISGSHVVTAVEYEEDRGKWKDYQVVCNCTVGYRSGQYAKRLMGEGVKAANLRGGIVAYTQAGLPLVDPSTAQDTKRVHVCAPRWAMQGDGYIPVVFKQPLLSMAKEALGNAIWGRKVT